MVALEKKLTSSRYHSHFDGVHPQGTMRISRERFETRCVVTCPRCEKKTRAMTRCTQLTCTFSKCRVVMLARQ